MNINPHNNANHLYAQNLGKSERNAPAKLASEQNAPLAGSADKLQLSALDKLRSEPEIRPEMVAKGRELLADPNYPSKEMMFEMAKLIMPFADDE